MSSEISAEQSYAYAELLEILSFLNKKFIEKIPFKLTGDQINAIDEITDYYWRKDKDDNSVDLPQDKNDHAMDMLKYL